ncbi:MAG: metallophosphoesterase [SAR324 cluster bacterium]|nr:metallophosphoesterase [SAR324 cluster bacterium]
MLNIRLMRLLSRIIRSYWLWLLIFALSGVYAGFNLRDFAWNKGCVRLAHDLEPALNIPEKQDHIFFLAIGDTGTGDENQQAVANSMQKLCEAQTCDFILLLGDNFYEKGIKSIRDKKFQRLFEQPYRNLNLPFLVTLGNHDVKGDAMAQVLKTLSSDKWNMPNIHYQTSAGPAQIYSVNGICHLSGMQWLWQHLRQDRPWNIVFSHYPIYSSGAHGDHDFSIRTLWQALFANKVDVYVSGHDHYLAHLQQNGDRTEYVVSGAGGQSYAKNMNKSIKLPTSSAAETRFYAMGPGFTSFEVAPDHLTLRFYDREGHQIYEYMKHRTQ